MDSEYLKRANDTRVSSTQKKREITDEVRKKHMNHNDWGVIGDTAVLTGLKGIMSRRSA